jgi:hypothetical protein
MQNFAKFHEYINGSKEKKIARNLITQALRHKGIWGNDI